VTSRGVGGGGGKGTPTIEHSTNEVRQRRSLPPCAAIVRLQPNRERRDGVCSTHAARHTRSFGPCALPNGHCSLLQMPLRAPLPPAGSPYDYAAPPPPLTGGPSDDPLLETLRANPQANIPLSVRRRRGLREDEQGGEG